MCLIYGLPLTHDPCRNSIIFLSDCSPLPVLCVLCDSKMLFGPANALRGSAALMPVLVLLLAYVLGVGATLNTLNHPRRPITQGRIVRDIKVIGIYCFKGTPIPPDFSP